MIAVKHHHAGVDKADENSQSLETYDAMRKTTENEREAKDQTREQVNKYYLTIVIIWISEIDPSTDMKVETEMLSVKMHLAKTTRRNQVKFGDDAEKFVSDDAKKALAEATQLLENVSEQSSKAFLIYETLKTKPQMRKKVHQIKGRREVLEKPQEHNKENGKDDNDELRNIAGRFNRMDATLHKISGDSTARVPSC